MSNTLSKRRRLATKRSTESNDRVSGSARKQGPPLRGDSQWGKKQGIALHDSRGMVSILVTMIIMIVISLIVLGFARIIRREQRQVLDRQLSTQAFYAAETGVSDAISKMKGGYIADKTECGEDNVFNKSSLDSSTGISYSCLLIDQSPNSLEYSNIATNKSTTIPIEAKSGNINKLTLSWQDTSGNTDVNCIDTKGNFPAVNFWRPDCNAGVLRVDLVPIGSDLRRSKLVSDTLTVFLQPVNSGNSNATVPSVTTANNGDIIDTKCTTNGTPKLCSVTFEGGLLAGPTKFYLRVRSIYKSNSLNITAWQGGTQLELLGAQTVVDSTGKANDVLRRIVVRVPIGGINDTPDYAIQSSDSICKRLSVGPGVASTDQADPACALP